MASVTGYQSAANLSLLTKLTTKQRVDTSQTQQTAKKTKICAAAAPTSGTAPEQTAGVTLPSGITQAQYESAQKDWKAYGEDYVKYKNLEKTKNTYTQTIKSLEKTSPMDTETQKTINMIKVQRNNVISEMNKIDDIAISVAEAALKILQQVNPSFNPFEAPSEN